MKKTLKKLVVAVAVIASMSSCTVIEPYAVTEAKIGGKKGTSETGVLFGTIQLNNNYGVAEAAKNGKLTGGIATVDRKITWHPFAFIFYKKTLIVNGN